MPYLLLPRSLNTAWRSPWGQIQPDVHQAFQGQEKLKWLSIILGIRNKRPLSLALTCELIPSARVL